jgi:hypothetical protein
MQTNRRLADRTLQDALPSLGGEGSHDHGLHFFCPVPGIRSSRHPTRLRRADVVARPLCAIWNFVDFHLIEFGIVLPHNTVFWREANPKAVRPTMPLMTSMYLQHAQGAIVDGPL